MNDFKNLSTDQLVECMTGIGNVDIEKTSQTITPEILCNAIKKTMTQKAARELLQLTRGRFITCLKSFLALLNKLPGRNHTYKTVKNNLLSASKQSHNYKELFGDNYRKPIKLEKTVKKRKEEPSRESSSKKPKNSDKNMDVIIEDKIPPASTELSHFLNFIEAVNTDSVKTSLEKNPHNTLLGKQHLLFFENPVTKTNSSSPENDNSMFLSNILNNILQGD